MNSNLEGDGGLKVHCLLLSLQKKKKITAQQEMMYMAHTPPSLEDSV